MSSVKSRPENRKQLTKKQKETTAPNPYIMGAASSHMGVDTVHMTLRCRIKDSSLLVRLQESKEQLQQSDHGNETLFLFRDCKQEFAWNLQRQGVKFYPYVLRGGDLVLMLSNRDHDSSIPNVKLEMGSISSQRGAWDEYQLLVYWLSLYGLEVEESIVNRIDLAVDIFEMDFEESSQRIMDSSRRICRSTEVGYYESSYKMTGFNIGKGDLQLRVYNKSFELLKPHNGHKLEFFYDLWQLPIGTPVTRFEFQLRGNVLNEMFKEKNLRTVLENVPNAWQYLTTDWCRLTAFPVDRKNKNHKRSKTSFVWSMVQHAGTTFMHQPVKRVRTNKPLLNVTNLQKQLAGVAMLIAAASGEVYFDLERLFQHCQKALNEGLDYQVQNLVQLYKKYREKQAKVFSPLYTYEKPLSGCLNLMEVPF